MEPSRAEGKMSLRYKKEEEEEEEEEEEDVEEEDEDVDCGEEEHNRRKRVMRDIYRKRGSRTRTGTGGSSMPPSCQVHGCEADLSGAKQYHRRHKVCDYHAKEPAVLIAGLRQRFCQQCSRFHELSEFDDSKRSCRRRLAGHNERRRKIASDYHGEGYQ